MKNVISVFLGVVCAILIGSVFMDTANVNEVINEVNDYKVFQLGAYKDEFLAKDTISKYGGKIVFENDYFYVYYSILSDASNIERLSNYLNNKKISFYIKSIDISSNELKNNIDNYEELMKNTTTDIAFIELNKKLINLYGDGYEN